MFFMPKLALFSVGFTVILIGPGNICSVSKRYVNTISKGCCLHYLFLHGFYNVYVNQKYGDYGKLNFRTQMQMVYAFLSLLLQFRLDSNLISRSTFYCETYPLSADSYSREID